MRLAEEGFPDAGSSPLSRRILAGRIWVIMLFQIIPALAGNTRRCRPFSWTRRDHPRSRGEYFTGASVILKPEGSSPLSRGIRAESCNGAGAHRIIPALAGNTPGFAIRLRIRRDHPRSRGEYCSWGRWGWSWWGSSPLSRGILLCAPRRGPNPRIIPALAGNTRPRRRRFPGWWDHPRSRGEYVGIASSSAEHVGSSPLSRGIQIRVTRQISYRRIIPALAGNTPHRIWKQRKRRDHPRSRGEYAGGLDNIRRGFGSSPLSRGIPRTDRPILGPHRIIPALAGNTRL